MTPTELTELDRNSEVCQKCGCAVAVVWGTSNELWNRIEDGNALRCVRCFADDAEAKGVFVAFTAVLHDDDWHPHREGGDVQ